ncbi:RIP metalloprotease RseP [Clostridium sp. 'deep sea']|uniref:RIP metalloprotease RseP n=1 Tax=Clostridium sp. 'deep sea' TaxID=2779445 RepID=UPI00189671E3|nr:RIP metalloprotease RseP [Clostridium sp. 'deep sea']QOR36025.1 RIP metalloprotease RseP [Clostridium sp. 'deep sea']
MVTTVIITILILGVMILFHELGHFMAAKAADVHVYEFALGMGPKLFSFKKGETEYTLRAIPMGGFVRMAGEDPEEDDDPRGLNKKSYLARIIISVAGAFMNFVLAVLIYTIVVFAQGTPDGTAYIGEVLPDSPAAEVGLQAGDKLTSIEGVSINSWEDLTKEIKQRPDQNLVIKIERGTEIIEYTLKTKIDELSEEGYIGIAPRFKRASFMYAIVTGFKQTILLFKLIFTALLAIITGKAGAQGAGPLGIAQMVGQVSQTGLVNTLSFTAMLSINVGIFNLLPIPPLDGSRILLIVIEAIRGKPMDPKKENLIFFIGFALLIIFAVFVTYQDILRLGN